MAKNWEHKVNDQLDQLYVLDTIDDIANRLKQLIRQNKKRDQGNSIAKLSDELESISKYRKLSVVPMLHSKI
jgi:hypothetical protein